MARTQVLTRRARAGRLRGSDLVPPSITASNLGDQGVDSVLGVIYPPQVALVGFGAVATGPGRWTGSSACGRSSPSASPETTGRATERRARGCSRRSNDCCRHRRSSEQHERDPEPRHRADPERFSATTLREIVPDASLDELPATDLRETFELDSLDFVELVERLGKRAGFRIEDDDADQLRTIDSATAFLARGATRTADAHSSGKACPAGFLALGVSVGGVADVSCRRRRRWAHRRDLRGYRPLRGRSWWSRLEERQKR